MPAKKTLLALGGIALAILTDCNCGGAPGTGGPCSGNEDCNSGECVDGKCVEPCAEGTEGCGCSVGACQGSLYCTDENLCAPCTNDVVDCPCDGGECDGDLVCDADTERCRVALACSEAGCETNQACEEGGTGEDAHCLADCLPGYAWNETTEACDAIVEANCEADVQGSILADCRALNRACVDTQEGAECGSCLEYFVDDGGSLATCRASLVCDDLPTPCADVNRTCVERTTTAEAFCDACVSGYHEVDGTCVEIPIGSCSEGDPNSIVAVCEERARQCVEPVTGRAYCGDCLPGYAASDPDPAPCLDPTSCEALDCAGLSRVCPPAPRTTCGECLPGLVPTDANDPASPCRLPQTCAELSCPEFCVERTGGDGECISAVCTNEDEAYREDAATCVACGGVCDATGETGRWWPYTAANSDRCICETEPSYYFDLGGSLSAKPCDSDGDGWVRSSARAAVESNDPSVSSNARCAIRIIDRFVLENEYQEQLELRLCQDGIHQPEDGPCNGLAPVPLYESVRNDSQVEVDAAAAIDLPAYAAGGVGRRPRAAELNPLTKACVSQTGDFNDNEVADLDEWQRSPENSSVFDRFAHFTELHRSYYAAPEIGELYGRYVIRERSRCESTFPVRYLADEGGYWRGCTRKRDAAFDMAVPPLVGFDFAEWSCDITNSSCPTPPPTADPPAGSDTPLHGLCDVSLPPGDDLWRGMGHHSQFKCVAIADVISPDLGEILTRRTLDQLYNGGGTPTEDALRDQLNRCRIACPAGDDDCSLDCIGDSGGCGASSEDPVSSANSTNPYPPVVVCDPVLREEAAVDEVGFSAMRQASEPYARGCINEFDEVDYRALCPGYVANPLGIVGESDIDAFGSLICGCGHYFGGWQCAVGCPEPDAFWSESYDAATREGFWLCGRTQATPQAALNATPADPTIGYSVRGNIPARVRTLGGLCEEPTCTNGFFVH